MIEQIKIYWHSFGITKMPVDYHKYLIGYNDYYRNLHPILQNQFRERVFIAMKFMDFRPVHFDTVTEEMKVVITSALIQITFGLDKYILRRFKTILVVPNTYSIAQFDALLGHVDHDKNLIAMSWPAVKEGFILPSDAHNVALHKLAHALQQENHDRLFFADFFDAVNVEDWNREGLKELWKIRRKKHAYLRHYAGINMMELFAVSIECFFEQPLAFKENVPGLFLIMTKLLRQEPSVNDRPVFRVV